jgi:excisionase family DNA binding protein
MTDPEAPDRWLTVPEVAKRFGVSPRTIYRMVEERTAPFHRLPGTATVRFSPADIRAIEEAAEVRPLRR